MPVDYSFDAAKSRVHTRCHGAVRFPEVIAHFRSLAEAPQIPDALDVMLDFRDLTAHPDRDQVRSVALEVRRLLPQVNWGRCAIVATDDLSFGIGRMFEMLTEGYFRTTMVFRTRDEAEAWLDGPGVPVA